MSARSTKRVIADAHVFGMLEEPTPVTEGDPNL